MAPGKKPDTTEALDFAAVQKQEQVFIAAGRGERQKLDPAVKVDDPAYTGLCFSGGGIRSATFNLGVLQALAKLKLLTRFDYLSTVSGGGYIGSWLTAWTHRAGFREVIDELANSAVVQRGRPEAPEIRWLRQFSNYLTPRLGLFSGDTWAMIGIYLRNTGLNLTILVFTLGALLLVPYLSGLAIPYFWDSSRAAADQALWGAFALLAVGVWITTANLTDLTRSSPQEGRSPFAAKSWVIHALVIVPALLAAYLLSAWVWMGRSNPDSFLRWPAAEVFWKSGALVLALWASGWSLGALTKFIGREFFPQRKSPEEPEARAVRFRRGVWITLIAFPAGGVGGWVLAWLFKFLENFSAAHPALPEWHVGMWGASLAALVFLIVETVHIGLVGRGFSEDLREWWGRLGGLFLLWSLAVMALYAISLDFPLLFLWLKENGYLATWGKALLGSAWAGVTGAGIWAGRSEESSNGKSTVKNLVGRIAPATFVIGLLLLLSLGIHRVLPLVSEAEGCWVCVTHNMVSALPAEEAAKPAAPAESGDLLEKLAKCICKTEPPVVPLKAVNYWPGVEHTFRPNLLWILLLLIALALLLSWRVGINEFSMHAFYRNRLVRCYLGASRFGQERSQRDPQPFTGFDPADDLPFWELQFTPASWAAPAVSWLDSMVQKIRTRLHMKEKKQEPAATAKLFAGPFHIVNTALNLVGGDNLAWQQRKAASFSISGSHAGYEIELESGCKTLSAFQRTAECAERKDRNPLTLGMALATSGAAASPNMGYHSSPTLAFLMTVFNVRLGWWLPNPKEKGFWQSHGPGLGLLYLLAELTGQTNHNRRYVYLSDGGHFENLGIYELVRRRCRFVVACDAGADSDLKFEDLGNAIEKCRTDFGVDIKIDVEQIRRAENGRSPWHCAVGTIYYDRVDPDAQNGTLLYLKASLHGDEPTDVLRYASANPSFPHQSTADQFFDESQFESYRMLGFHIVHETLEAAGSRDDLCRQSTSQIFLALRQSWYPPSKHVSESFTKHTAAYKDLMRELREDETLRFLDTQVWPEWPSLMPDAWHESNRWSVLQKEYYWLPDSAQERRAGFYFATRMLQLMEDVYVDLNLEEEWEHPDNRGWMNVFHHWAWSGMVVATWAIAASTFGARFQTFVRRRLGLSVAREARLSGSSLLLQKGWGQETWNHELQAAQESRLLNYWEVEIIQNILNPQLYTSPDDPGEPLSETLMIAPYELVVKGPSPGKEIRFTSGFAILTLSTVHPMGLRYLRIQNHLRRLGLGRDFVAQLKKMYPDLQFAPFPMKKRPPVSSNEPISEAWPDDAARVNFRQFVDSVTGS